MRLTVAPAAISAAPRPRRRPAWTARSALHTSRGGARTWARDDPPIAARRQVAHVRARLGGGPGDAQLAGGVAQALVHELTAVPRNCASTTIAVGRRDRRRRPAEHAAGGDRGAPMRPGICVPIPVIRMTMVRMTRLFVNPCEEGRASIPLHREPNATAHDQRRRGRARGRVAIDGVARAVRKGPGARLRGHPGAREALQRAQLGYRPNVAAQALRLGSSRAVALLVPDITNPFFSRVLRGAQRAARSAGYTVALFDTANDRRWEEQTFEALRAGPVDGYLLFEVGPPEGPRPRR